MKALIPLYDLSYSARVLAAAKVHGKKMAIIVNVNDGPGDSVDSRWLDVISQLRRLGCELYGYVDMVKWVGKTSIPRDASAIRSDLKGWEGYGMYRAFYDDWQNGRTLKTPPVLNGCIANPGCDDKTNCSVTLVWETEKYLSSPKHKTPGNVAVFAMGESDFAPALSKAKERGVAYFYAVAASDTWAAYDKLPPYFDKLIQSI
jgi:hypothetical protein